MLFINLVSPLIVFASVEIGTIIIFGAGLSFLGLGVQAPLAEWGLMMAEGRDVLAVAPMVATFPGLAILLVVLGLSLLGEGCAIGSIRAAPRDPGPHEEADYEMSNRTTREMKTWS